MKFVLFVEGHTEKPALPPFLKRWLDGKLKRPVGIHPVRFDGWAEMVRDAPLKAKMYLEAPGKEVIAVIAILDLYGPTFYPQDKTLSPLYPTDTTLASARCQWAKEDIEKKVNHPRFRQFFAVHETEAWLLSDPNIFPPPIREEVRKLGLPEMVNFQKPPAKRLNGMYQTNLRRDYKKVTDGSNLFRQLDPGLAYEKCPNLKSLLDEMLKLAKEAGL